MAAPATVIEVGSFTNITAPVDENSGAVLVTDVNKKYTREKRELKGAITQCVTKLRYRNPILAILITASVATASGLATTHPGTVVATLANFAATTRGFDPAVGQMVLEDIEDDFKRDPDIDAMWQTKLPITHYPLAPAA